MKTKNSILVLLVLLGILSCENNDTTENQINNNDSLKNKESYLNYLKDKAVISIHIYGGKKYILTSRNCDTCYVSPLMSSIPDIKEWTVIDKTSYRNFKVADFPGFPVSDSKGNIYTANKNTIYKTNSNGENEEILNTGDYSFKTFVFDRNDNIWLLNSDGIAFWNKSKLTIFNSGNTPLFTRLTHGIAIDESGIAYVCLDFEGLLKIENGKWTVIPNSEIPGLTKHSYLHSPKANTEGVWFQVFTPASTTGFLRLKDNNWIYEYPDTLAHSDLRIDSKGIIWSINRHYNVSEYQYTTLRYYNNGSWVDFNISDIESRIITVNADETTVYIGTVNGLIEKQR